MKILMMIGLALATGSWTKSPPVQVDPCGLYGSVYVEEVPGFADYQVFREDVENFADLVVFQEQAPSFADGAGLWFITDTRAFADFTVAYVDTKGFADFSVHYSEFRTVAGCR